MPEKTNTVSTYLFIYLFFLCSLSSKRAHVLDVTEKIYIFQRIICFTNQQTKKYKPIMKKFN